MTSPFQESESPANSCRTPLKLAALRKMPRLDDGAPDDKRKEIALYFTNTFDTYTRLFECLADDAGYYQKSIPLRHPLIFYLGHTATFFVNKLVLAKRLPERIHLETSSVLIRQHDLARVQPRPEWAPVQETGDAPTNELITVPAGTIRIGCVPQRASRRLAITLPTPIYPFDNFKVHPLCVQAPLFPARRIPVYRIGC